VADTDSAVAGGAEDWPHLEPAIKNPMSEPRTEQLPDFLDALDGDTQAEPAGALKTGPLRFARMSGSSIADRDAAPWVTDFLNAAYWWPPARARAARCSRAAT
jgi:hypothetical protein